MAILVGIIILAVVIIWSQRQSAGGIGGGIGGGPGGRAAQKKRVSCQWERVNANETRALKEYRCGACGEVAYGRQDTPPAARPCRAG